MSWRDQNTVGKSEDIAESVIWLMSENSEFVTGAVLSVDGGMSAM
jgi:NAD(P)-dependent dehydrogenase (short-subunit alcohol dehydrogenase family)